MVWSFSIEGRVHNQSYKDCNIWSLVTKVGHPIPSNTLLFLSFIRFHITHRGMACHSLAVMPQFDWLCDVCGCVMSPTSDIYWVELNFINNCKEPQLWLVLLRYSADVASAFSWVITYGIKAGSITSCGLGDTISQSGS